METFDKQLKFWTDNGFVGDMIRISRNAERFVQLLQTEIDEGRPQGSASRDIKHQWNGHVHENSQLLDGLYDAGDFVLGWLDSGHDGRKEEILKKIHIAKACVVPRRGTPKASGLCSWCSLLPGNVTLIAEEVDHIIPFSFFPQFDGQDWNYQGLCKNHNSQKGSFPVPVQAKMASKEMLRRIWKDLT